MNQKYTLAFIDVETTGLDFFRNEIIQIGLVLAEETQINDKLSIRIISEHEYKIKPKHIETADLRSLRVNGYSADEWQEALELDIVMNILAKKIDGAVLVSHNTPFDFAFLDKAFKDCGLINPLHYHTLDTISLAHAKISGDVKTYSLHTLCQHFGIVNDNEHRALSDAQATYELYKKLMGI